MANGDDNSVGLVETQVVRLVEPEAPLRLECGKTLGPKRRIRRQCGEAF